MGGYDSFLPPHVLGVGREGTLGWNGNFLGQVSQCALLLPCNYLHCCMLHIKSLQSLHSFLKFIDVIFIHAVSANKGLASFCV